MTNFSLPFVPSSYLCSYFLTHFPPPFFFNFFCAILSSFSPPFLSFLACIFSVSLHPAETLVTPLSAAATSAFFVRDLSQVTAPSKFAFSPANLIIPRGNYLKFSTAWILVPTKRGRVSPSKGLPLLLLTVCNRIFN